jgi:hypothetical protein
MIAGRVSAATAKAALYADATTTPLHRLGLHNRNRKTRASPHLGRLRISLLARHWEASPVQLCAFR